MTSIGLIRLRVSKRCGVFE